MRLIGLDVGDRRVGIAFGDTGLRIATPVDVVARHSIEADGDAIRRLIRKYDADKIIVGMPRNMDGTLGAQAEATRDFVKNIAPALKIPIEFWDERLTTVEAERQREQSGAPARRQSRGARRAKRPQRDLDAVAAAILLQDYMDAQASTQDENAS